VPIRVFGMTAPGIYHRRSRLAARCWAAVLAVAAAAGLATPAKAEVVAKAVTASPAQVRAYWTPERMQAAEPADLPQVVAAPVAAASRASTVRRRPTSIHGSPGIAAFDFEPGAETGFPQRVHGKIFFTAPGVGDAACSGTIVASRLRNVVFTAGHCVIGAPGQWSTNLVFVPGYRDGSEPFGEFPATALLAPDEWVATGDIAYDVAIAQLSVPLEATLGARGIAFNKPPRSDYAIFGYPGKPAPPYNGQRLIQCDAPFYGLEVSQSHPFSTVAYPCDMRQGASGGGWVNSAGQVVSVVSHGYEDPSRTGQIVGPYFGDAVKRLYNRAGGSAQCQPAQQALGKAKKRFRRTRKAVTRAAGGRAQGSRVSKRLRKARRGLEKAKQRHSQVC
jgi:Trypsin-like peptidase domain